MVSKMEAGLLDAAPIWTNLKTFPWAEFRDRVDILSGGYPCQPFSAAGKRLGKEDPRHLWPWIADGIASMRPRVCFFENVEGHISLGLREVIEDLERLGYNSTWGIFSASEVGAPHQRKRVFILAYLIDERSQGWLHGWSDSQRQGVNGYAGCCGAGGGVWPSRPGEPQHEWEPPRVVGNTTKQGLPFSGGECGAVQQSGSEQKPERSDDYSSIRQTQPSLGGDSDGTADWVDYAELFVTSDNRTDELRLLGNGVVPATAERAFLTLYNQLINEKP